MREVGASEYASRQSLLIPFGSKLEGLLRDLIDAAGVTVLDVVHRIKTHASASKKLAASPEKYGSLGELHDMLGLRVISYLASDVELIVAKLRDNFEVDEDRSLDKQAGLDPDRFGYLSYHLVARLNSAREDLEEWNAYRGIYFEIQIRSVLQHAWAEIEHDLGYKSASGVPAHIRRRFARLAGLLELADSEFDAVSREVAAHVSRVEEVVASGGNLAIDRDSIHALILADGPVYRADLAITEALGATLDQEILPYYPEGRARELLRVGFESIDEVASEVEGAFDALVQFAAAWFQNPDPEYLADDDEWNVPSEEPHGQLPRGVSLFYLYLHTRLQEPGAEQNLEEIGDLHIPEVQVALREIHDRFFPPARKRLGF